MQSSDNRTFFPNPGGDRPQTEQSDVPGLAADLPEVHAGNNPLIAAANPLINMIYQVRTLVHHPDPASLRDLLAQEVHRFEARAKYAGISSEHVMAARYCLCTVLDETAAQTPWGNSGTWSRHSLLVQFHNETWGGERFFNLLSKLTQSPLQHRDLIELMYFCICLGFEGRYRIVPNGAVELEKLRRRVAALLEDMRDGSSRGLSPQWRGSPRPLPPVWRTVPVWVSGVLALLLGSAAYAGIMFNLSDRSDVVFRAITSLVLPSLPAMPDRPMEQPRLAQFLEHEIAEGLVSVDEYPHQSIVTLRGDSLFDSGSVQPRAQYRPVLERIAFALAQVPGRVEVIGHTDSIPIRTLRFPSNWELSKERAEQVAVVLENAQSLQGRIRIQGRGESEPLATNETAPGRAMNRRVEIIVHARPGELSREVR